jgi:hypothetical protein
MTLTTDTLIFVLVILLIICAVVWLIRRVR